MRSPRTRQSGRRSCLTTVVTSALLAALGAATPALAKAAPVPHWKLESRVAPTNLPLNGEGVIVVTLANLGAADVDGTTHEVTVSDNLEGLEATEVQAASRGTPRSPENVREEANGFHGVENPDGFSCSKAPAVPIVCTFGQKLPPYEQLEIVIKVKAKTPASPEPLNQVTVIGGEAAPASLSQALAVNGDPTGFGLERLELTPESENGSEDVEAGSHPFQMTTVFDLNQKLELGTKGEVVPGAPALEKDLRFKLPPGLIGDANVLGNANAVQQCDGVDFGAFDEGDVNSCPNDTVIGVAAVTFFDPISLNFATSVVPVFNLVPARGEPARFGFEIVHVPIILDTSVRTGEDYGVTVSVENASEAVQILGSRVTFWGVPGASAHDRSRGWACLSQGSPQYDLESPCTSLGLSEPAPFLTLPTSCGPLTTSVAGDAWNPAELEEQGEPTELGQRGESLSNSSPTTLEGCGKLPFAPSIEVKPETEAASTPTGLNVDVKVPQEATLTAGDLAEADIKETTLALPEGMQASAGAANGLQTCSAAQLGLDGGFPEASQTENEDRFSSGPADCPNASKIGAVEIETPLLHNKLVGGVYMAEQDTNPFASPLVIYITAEEPTSRVLVKLAGEVQINPATGQLTSVFRNTPQSPFSELRLHLFNEAEGASQATPSFCNGDYESRAAFKTWSTEPGSPEATTAASSSFAVTSGPNGTPCPGARLPFAPSIQTGPTSSQAAAETPFTVTIGRPDGQQALESIRIELPPGAAALISQVTPCSEAQAQADACPAESIVGHTTSVSGLGGNPVSLPGTLYLTGALKATSGHGEAPFGLLDVTPAIAGPFDLGDVSVLSTINVNDVTAAATVTSEQIPKIIKGVPVQLKELNVTVERPGNQPFELNPTNCLEELKITGGLAGYEGGSSAISERYPVSDCTSLPFAPKLTVSVAGHGSKTDGTSFAVTLDSPGLGQANIRKVDLTIPAKLPSRLTTIQQACVEAVFNANPSECDEGSVIGEGIVHTPVFKNPLRGPAYLVSHGGAGFPDVEFVLQGEGIELILDGKTDIKHGVTYSRFETNPDAPFTEFEAILPAGPHSALTPNVPEREDYNLCNTSLTVPTEITSQNGALISETTNVNITGCKVTPGPTQAQLLAKALRVCEKDKSKHKRRACEKLARKKYGAKASRSSRAKRSRRRRERK